MLQQNNDNILQQQLYSFVTKQFRKGNLTMLYNVKT